MVAVYGDVPDPRSCWGRRHDFGFVLGVVTATAERNSLTAIAQGAAAALAGRSLRWVGGDPFIGQVTSSVAAHPRPVLAGVDPAGLQTAADAWTRAHTDLHPGDAVAIDGESVCGAGGGDRPMPHLLAVATNDGVVLGQHQIPCKSSKSPHRSTA